MKLILSLFLLLSINVNAYNAKDTTWDLQGQVLLCFGNVIKGVTIKNAIIEANPYIQIFDTTVTLINCRTKEFSTAWFGASPSIADNSVYIQKCISTCIANNIANLYCADSYLYSKKLLAFNLYQGIYVGFGLNFYGDGDFWNQRQTLTYTGNEFAFGVQVAKGGSIKGICFIGQNIGAGIVIDYDNTKNHSGSTGFRVEDCIVGNFITNYYVSPKQAPYNGDNLIFKNIQSRKCVNGFMCMQPQNKGVTVDGFYSWDSCQTAIRIFNANVNISNVRIAFYCKNILDVSLSGWNTFSLSHVYAESVMSLGSVSAQNSVYLPPVTLQNMELQFIPGSQVLFTSNSPKVKISNSALWFYNGICCQQMNFSGPFIWDNNDCGSCYINNPQIRYVNAMPLNPVSFK